jgi:16S rRNA (uracil1498-N3)-methyltransferase
MGHRFFVSPADFAQQPVVLTGEQAHQVRRVLRLRLGETVTLLDGRGAAGEAQLIALDERSAGFQVTHRWRMPREPGVHITLYQAALKGERFGWALQKGTEVGISRFVPVVCERNVVDDLDAVEDKRDRWQRIIQEAAEQSGRSYLPELSPAQFFNQAVQASEREEISTVRLIPWEGEREARLRDVLVTCNLTEQTRIQLFVGPEGGYSEGEIALARHHGIQPISLGPRILRAETAGVVAAAAILYQAGEF